MRSPPIRETFEETGLLLGAKARRRRRPSPDRAWAAFADAGILPDLSTMHFIARAITPPRRKRRYDTRFFTADASAIAHRIEGKVGADSELVELVWLPLSEIKQRIELMAITEIVLRDLQRPDRKAASATTCRCRSTMSCTARRVRDLL